MEELPKLKYLKRGPLPLNRIPDHLCVQIIEKQSVAPLFNLPHTNSRYAGLVESVVAQNPYLTIVRNLLEFYDKEELFGNRGTHLLFPASDYLGSLCSWIVTISLDIKSHLGDKSNKRAKRVIPEINRLRYMNTSHISELWEKEQRLGPKKVSLHSIPDQLWKQILSKATAVTATRLARTTSTAAAALDDYVESAVPVRVMVKNNHLLTDREKGRIKWLILNEYENFYNSSLFKKSMCRVLWKFSPSPLDQTPEEEEIIKRLRALAAEATEMELEEIRQKHAILGQEDEQTVYSPDEAALRVPVKTIGSGIPLLQPIIPAGYEEISFDQLYTAIKLLSSHQVEMRRRNPNWKEVEARLEARLERGNNGSFLLPKKAISMRHFLGKSWSTENLSVRCIYPLDVASYYPVHLHHQNTSSLFPPAALVDVARTSFSHLTTKNTMKILNIKYLMPMTMFDDNLIKMIM